MFDTDIKTHYTFQVNKTRLSYSCKHKYGSRLDCRIAVNIRTDLDVIRWPLWNGIVIAKGLNIITKNCMIADCTKFVT